MRTLGRHFIDTVSYLLYLKDGPKNYGKLTKIQVEKATKLFIRQGSFDRFTVWETWSLKEYNPRGFEIKPYDVVLDLGAQIGEFSVYAAKKAKGGKVFAYEPFPESFKILMANKKLNKLKNLKPVKLAVSGKKGRITFFVSKKNSAANSPFRYMNDHLEKKVGVRSDTLKNIFARNKLTKIDFLKIDIEGSEFEVIMKAPHNVLKKVEKIVMEVHGFIGGKKGIESIKKRLEESGFSVRQTRYPFSEVGMIFAKRT